MTSDSSAARPAIRMLVRRAAGLALDIHRIGSGSRSWRPPVCEQPDDFGPVIGERRETADDVGSDRAQELTQLTCAIAVERNESAPARSSDQLECCRTVAIMTLQKSVDRDF
jgi:hypothetical protein